MTGTILAAATLVGCGAAGVETVVPGSVPITALPGHGGYELDCDAALGRERSETRDIAATSGFATGELYFRVVRVPDALLPIATVLLVSDDAHRERAGIRFIRYPSAPDLAVLQIVYFEPEHPIAQVISPDNRRAALGHDMGFALRWHENLLEVRVAPDSDWVHVPLRFVPSRIELACSSAEAIFHSVSILSPIPALGAAHRAARSGQASAPISGTNRTSP